MIERAVTAMTSNLPVEKVKIYDHAGRTVFSSNRAEIGERNGLEAEVLSGLEDGEQVIVHPSDKIADGVAVEERSV